LSTRSTEGPIVPAADGVGVWVHARPGARRDSIEGLRATANGSMSLLIAVRAAPENGKANAAIARLLAEAFDMPKSRLRLAAGATSRRKLFIAVGEPEALRARLEGWLKQWTLRQ
jgi:uncharacterized protein